MPVLKVYKNGAWEEIAGMSGHTHRTTDIVNFPTKMPADGGNADTVGGMSPSEFASASDFSELQDRIDNMDVTVSWDDLEDKPFYSEKSYYELAYDEEHQYNVTLQSGETLYYVRDEWFFPDIAYVKSAFGWGTKEDEFNNICTEPIHITGTDPYGDNHDVRLYEFNIIDETYTNNKFMFFCVDSDEITFNYQEETLTLNHGWYVSRYGYMWLDSIVEEGVTKLDDKYISSNIARLDDIKTYSISATDDGAGNVTISLGADA